MIHVRRAKARVEELAYGVAKDVEFAKVQAVCAFEGQTLPCEAIKSLTKCRSSQDNETVLIQFIPREPITGRSGRHRSLSCHFFFDVCWMMAGHATAVQALSNFDYVCPTERYSGS
jgi:hypothetical protein